MKKPLVILTGPTAVGKQHFPSILQKPSEARSFLQIPLQVYRGMDIGSAKIRTEEMDGVPASSYRCPGSGRGISRCPFSEDGERGHGAHLSERSYPILTGGTGFYIQAILYDIDFTENGKTPLTGKAWKLWQKKRELEHLHEMLKNVDPVSAEEIHANNVKRVIRALEYFQQTGEPISIHNQREREKEAAYNSAYFVLNAPRPLLYERIDRRVDEMLENGLVEEVKRLRERGCTRELVSMQGLGYKEILAWLDGETSYEEAVEILKRDTRHFCQETDHLVQAGTGCDLDQQRCFCL
ncbi:MAG: tRNA (adenosine(37)-N6)-dimethylallyltransferase MiaA [Blautia sp.]